MNISNVLVPAEYPLAQTFNLDTNEVDPGITVSGFAIPDPATLSDPDEQKLAANLRVAIPSVDPNYQFRKDLVSAFNYWKTCSEGDVLFLHGPAGSGKSSLPEQVFARLGIPCFLVKGHRKFEPHEAFGHFILTEGGKTEWAPGPVMLAAQYGLPVIINEFDRIEPDRAIIFNDVFTGGAFPVPGKHGEVLRPRSGFCCVITGNTNLIEDTTGNYGTAHMHDISVLERICAIRVDYPEDETEKRLVMKEIEPFDDELLSYWFDQEGIKLSTEKGLLEGAAISRDQFAEGLVKVARDVRKMSKDSGNQSDAALERTMSTRILRKWAYHSVMHSSAPERLGLSALHLVLKKYLSSMATESTRIALHKAVETVFGVQETVA